jgi:hypothetical protein
MRLPDVVRMASLTPMERNGAGVCVTNLGVGNQNTVLVLPQSLTCRRVVVCGRDPSPVFVPVLMREFGNSPRGVSEGGA